MKRKRIHAHGHNTRLITPSPDFNDALENEARDHGWQCRPCGYMNLPSRRMCKRCKRRGRPTPMQEKAARQAAIGLKQG
jgi:uncharacterized OB-fold protein